MNRRTKTNIIALAMALSLTPLAAVAGNGNGKGADKVDVIVGYDARPASRASVARLGASSTTSTCA